MKRVIGLISLLVIMLLTAFFFFFRKAQINPVTGKKQYLSLRPEQEVTLGLQAAPELAMKFGGLDRDGEMQAWVRKIGRNLVASSETGKLPFQFDFHVLAEKKAVGAFALPGGQIFVTAGLLEKLKNENQIAAILAHEIGHVIGRHASEQLAKNELIGGVGISIGLGRDNENEKIEDWVEHFLNLEYNVDAENEADFLALKYLVLAGYKPAELLEVMKILKRPGGDQDFQFRNTHSDNLDALELAVAGKRN